MQLPEFPVGGGCQFGIAGDAIFAVIHCRLCLAGGIHLGNLIARDAGIHKRANRLFQRAVADHRETDARHAVNQLMSYSLPHEASTEDRDLHRCPGLLPLFHLDVETKHDALFKSACWLTCASGSSSAGKSKQPTVLEIPER
jgi:hypothetical protein